ncbi:MAG TPA: hypothetical protein VMV02_02165 [Acidimicrobiales bacterium]|nr:hypothetical protein [Acidimicrobiales bacterium]
MSPRAAHRRVAHPFRLPAVAAAACAAAVATSGPALASPSGANGVGSLPAAKILARSARALAARTAIDVAGSIGIAGEGVSFDVRSAARGRDVAGTITTRAGGKVIGPIRFVALPGTVYLDAPAAFWRQAITSMKGAPTGAAATAAVSALSGTWIAVGGAQARTFTTGFGGLTEPGKFAQNLLSGAGSLAKHAPTIVRGQRAVPVVTGQGATIYVALDGAPLPIEVRGTVALGALSVSTVAAISYPATQHIVAPAGARSLAAVAGSAGAG